MIAVRSELLYARSLLFVSGGLIFAPADDEREHRRPADDSEPTIRATAIGVIGVVVFTATVEERYAG
jgi:hypothetical protein